MKRIIGCSIAALNATNCSIPKSVGMRSVTKLRHIRRLNTQRALEPIQDETTANDSQGYYSLGKKTRDAPTNEIHSVKGWSKVPNSIEEDKRIDAVEFLNSVNEVDLGFIKNNANTGNLVQIRNLEKAPQSLDIDNGRLARLFSDIFDKSDNILLSKGHQKSHETKAGQILNVLQYLFVVDIQLSNQDFKINKKIIRYKLRRIRSFRERGYSVYEVNEFLKSETKDDSIEWIF